MTKQFYQCDVAESDTDSIWTGPVIYGTAAYAEFRTMLELQCDWGDGYMPDTFLDAFGSEPTLEALQERPDPQFPGDEAWNAAGYFDDIPSGVTTGMLTLDAATALAKLGKIEIAADVEIEALLANDNAKLLANDNPPELAA